MSFESYYKKIIFYILLSSLLVIGFYCPSKADIFEFGNFKVKNVSLNTDKNEIEKKNTVFETKQIKLVVIPVKTYERIKILPKESLSKAKIIKIPSVKIEKKLTSNKINRPQYIVKKLADSKAKLKLDKPTEKKHEVTKVAPLPLNKIDNTNEFENSAIVSSNEESIKNDAGSESLDQIKNAPWKKVEQNQPLNVVAKKDVTPDMGSILGGLSLVLLIIFVVWGLYMKFTGKGLVSGVASGQKNKKSLNFHLLSSASLGQGKDIHLVEINGKQIVIGSTANSINVLTELNDDDNEKLNEQLKSNVVNENVTEVSDDDTMYNDPQIYENSYAALYKEYLDKAKDEPK